MFHRVTFRAAAVAGCQKFRFYSTPPSSLVVRDLLCLIKKSPLAANLRNKSNRLTILLIVFGIVRPSEARAEPKIGQLNVSLLVD